MFHCKNGQCVDRSKVCDIKNDCHDYSDETFECGKILALSLSTENSYIHAFCIRYSIHDSRNRDWCTKGRLLVN